MAGRNSADAKGKQKSRKNDETGQGKITSEKDETGGKHGPDSQENGESGKGSNGGENENLDEETEAAPMDTDQDTAMMEQGEEQGPTADDTDDQERTQTGKNTDNEKVKPKGTDQSDVGHNPEEHEKTGGQDNGSTGLTNVATIGEIREGTKSIKQKADARKETATQEKQTAKKTNEPPKVPGSNGGQPIGHRNDKDPNSQTWAKSKEKGGGIPTTATTKLDSDGRPQQTAKTGVTGAHGNAGKSKGHTSSFGVTTPRVQMTDSEQSGTTPRSRASQGPSDKGKKEKPSEKGTSSQQSRPNGHKAGRQQDHDQGRGRGERSTQGNMSQQSPRYKGQHANGQGRGQHEMSNHGHQYHDQQQQPGWPGEGYGTDSRHLGQGHSHIERSRHDHQGTSYDWQQDAYGAHGRQDQMQGHIFRDAQASKQMVYGVFGNCITMLEEMESRELRKKRQPSLPRSNIYLPDQSKFDDKTIQRKLDTQFVLLQAQLTSCHEAIRDDVKDELKANTLHFCSQREAKNIPHGVTDVYAHKLFGLLETGRVEHPKAFSESPKIDEKGMQQAMGALMHGQQKRAELDQSFRDDPRKKAAGPNMRPSAGIDLGADRIARGNPQFERALNEYRNSLC